MAIQFDAVRLNYDNKTASPWAFSFTTTGSDIMLFVWVETGPASDIVTAVTFDGISLTKLRADPHVTDPAYLSLWYGLGITARTGNVSITFTTGGSNTLNNAGAISYTGVGGIDTSGHNDYNLQTSHPSILTTVSDNTWHVGFHQGSGYAGTAGSGATKRDDAGADVSAIICDNNGIITPPASHTLNMGSASNDNVTVQGVIIAPVKQASGDFLKTFRRGGSTI